MGSPSSYLVTSAAAIGAGAGAGAAAGAGAGAGTAKVVAMLPARKARMVDVFMISFLLGLLEGRFDCLLACFEGLRLSWEDSS